MLTIEGQKTAASEIAGVLMRGRWIGKEKIRKTMREIAASDHQDEFFVLDGSNEGRAAERRSP